MPYSPDSKLSYPSHFHPKSSLELFLVSKLSSLPDGFRDRDVYSATPRLLLVQYADSHLGKWHSEQVPRYPNFHRDLPESVYPQIPDITQLYRQTFGRAWLKNFVILGELTAIRGDNPDTTDERFPDFDVSDAIGPEDTQATDLHPIGHMVRTAVMLEETLRISEGSPYQLSNVAKYLTRSAMALHDIGENEHPGIIIETGEVVGDISAATGKTDANREQERKILESILAEEFSEYFDSDMREILSGLIGHRPHELDSEYINAHAIQEIAHNLNSVRTGMFAAGVGIRHAQTTVNQPTDHDISIVGHSMAMAEQHVKVLIKKFKEIEEDVPELYQYHKKPFIDDAMRGLKQKAHALDENEPFVRWRTSDAITAHYGDYRLAS